MARVIHLEKTAVKKQLERDLPFKLDVRLGEGRVTGTTINAAWSVPDADGTNRVMLHAVLGVPDLAGGQAVIQDVLLDRSLHGVSLGRVFARNALALLENAGAAKVGLTTSNNGAYFWQKIGFLADADGAVLDDDLEDDDIPMVIPYAQLCARIENRLTAYAAWGVVPEKTAQNILAALAPQDPASMGAVLDRDVQIPHLHAVLGRQLYAARDECVLPPATVVREKLQKDKLKKLFAVLGMTPDEIRQGKSVNLMQHMLCKASIAAAFDFASVQQRARLEKATAGARVNAKKLAKRLGRLGLAV